MITAAIIYGGVSEEHEVSLLSAERVYQALQELEYALIPIYYAKDGAMYLQDTSDEKPGRNESENRLLSVTPPRGFCRADGSPLPVDIIIPVVHGKGGEDGTLQGFLTCASIPFISCSLLSSAIGMHKSVAKTLASAGGIPVLPSILLTRNDIELFTDRQIISRRLRPLLGKGPEAPSFAGHLSGALKSKLGAHLILKPDDEGSSIGLFEIPEVDENSLQKALGKIFTLTDRILIEPFMNDMLEVECAVMEDEEWVVSAPLIIDKGGVPLSYHTKYEVAEALDTPGRKISEETISLIQSYALSLTDLLHLEGFARIDFFVSSRSEEIYFNEVNTIPGMTDRSVFPEMAEQSGYPLGRLLGLLIERKLWNP